MAPRQRSSPGSRRATEKPSPVPAAQGYLCGSCERTFKSAAGAASHRRSAHPVPQVVAVASLPSRPVPPPTPEGLGPSGSKIWGSVVESYDLRPDELRILEDACREALLIDRLDDELRTAPLIVKGSMGQPAANPLVQELRQHRATFAQLMARLKLTDADDEAPAESPAERTVKARAAANARWRRGPTA